MRLHRLCGVLLSLAFAVFGVRSHAQVAEQAILARLHDHAIFLRGFPVEDKLKYDAAGKPEGWYRSGSFTVCGFRADSVRLSDSRLQIDGVRIALRFDPNGVPQRTVLKTGGLFSREETVSIEIKTGGQTDFTQVLNAVFLDGFAELAPTLPEFWQRYMQEQTGVAQALPASSPGPFEEPAHVGSSVQPPHLLRAPAPRYTELAKRSRLSGKVDIYLICEADGLPSQIQIVRPLGMELDEAALAAVIGYRFAPATENGKPVRVDITVEVNFQLY